MRRRHALIVLAALWMLSMGRLSRAGSVSMWHDTTKADFDAGTLKDVSSISPGEVRLAPELIAVADVKASYVWSLALDGKGNVIAGTGAPGAVYRIASSDLSASLLYASPEGHVTAVSVDPEGGVYAAISPGGTVLKLIEGQEARVIADLPETYVWSLLLDEKGTLYAATGDAGKIYGISPDGKVSVFFVCQETHLLCMARDENGFLYAGTEPNGLVYRIDPSGKAGVILDAEEAEVHTLTLGEGGRAFAGTAQGGKLPFPGPPAPAPPREPRERILLGGAELPSRGSPGAPAAPAPPPGQGPLRNSVYFIEPFGDVRKLAALEEALVYSISTDRRGDLYVGTGPRGTLYQILLAPPQAATVRTLEQAQVLSMLMTPQGALFLGTANGGVVYRLGPGYPRDGEFVSRPLDAGMLSEWGQIGWTGRQPSGTSISLSTRTGNSSKPDLTWSEWSEERDGAAGFPIASPAGRTIQYKVRFRTDNPAITPVLEGVSIAYRVYNLPPEILHIIVPQEEEKPWTEAKEPAPAGQAPAKGLAHRGTIKFSWTAKDPNGDRLAYSIFYRREGELAWKLLEEELEKPEYSWDSESVADGYYFVRVAASDSPDNVRDHALSGERVSQRFVIDNTGPELLELRHEALGEGRYKLSGVARDATSLVAKLDYSVDGGDWAEAAPFDYIFDSMEERFAFELSLATGEEHTVRVRARDWWGNSVVGQVVLSPE